MTWCNEMWFHCFGRIPIRWVVPNGNRRIVYFPIRIGIRIRIVGMSTIRVTPTITTTALMIPNSGISPVNPSGSIIKGCRLMHGATSTITTSIIIIRIRIVVITIRMGTVCFSRTTTI